jgi:hypothetical protein
VDPQDILRRADLGAQELRRRSGGNSPGASEAVRQRLAALLQPSPVVDDPAAPTSIDDVRRCGALIVRLGGAATMTVVATWMGWTLERTSAAIAEVDQRLGEVGTQLVAGADGGLSIQEQLRHRGRPEQQSVTLLESLDDAAHRHRLAHLVRGDPCGMVSDWMQPLFDLGAAVPGRYPGAEPCDALGAAFGGIRRRVSRPICTVIGSSGRPWPQAQA